MEIQLHAPLLGVAPATPVELYALHAQTFEFHLLGEFVTLPQALALKRPDFPVLFYADAKLATKLVEYVESRQSTIPGKETYFWVFRPHLRLINLGQFASYKEAQDAFAAHYFPPEIAVLIPPEAVRWWKLQTMPTSKTKH